MTVGKLLSLLSKMDPAKQVMVAMRDRTGLADLRAQVIVSVQQTPVRFAWFQRSYLSCQPDPGDPDITNAVVIRI